MKFRLIHINTLNIIIRLLEECLEQSYSVEELHSKIRDILRLVRSQSKTVNLLSEN